MENDEERDRCVDRLARVEGPPDEDHEESDDSQEQYQTAAAGHGSDGNAFASIARGGAGGDT